MGKWKELAVDTDRGIATATPSITSKELSDAVMQHDFIFPGGHCPDVGLGGFLLQGGMGLNARV
jgi:FAD/FMN-containing dehydrogenase